VFFISLNIYGTDVNITTNFFNDKIKYNYTIDFKNKPISKFTMEIPLNSKVVKIYSKKNLNFSYLKDEIFVKNLDNDNLIFVELITKNGKINKDTFSNYIDFNFPIKNLLFNFNFNFNFDMDYSKINIYPKTSFIEKNKIIWKFEDISSELLIFIEFNENYLKSTKSIEYKESVSYLFILLIIPLILFIFFITFIFLKKDILKNNNIFNKKNTKIVNTKLKNLNKKDKINKKENLEFKNKIKKYLTENEKKIVCEIKKNEGISQLGILSSHPDITKSNLSKMISKLNSLKFLEKIRVGKETNLYLGSKLKFKKKEKEKENF
jgi:hypothetical protein